MSGPQERDSTQALVLAQHDAILLGRIQAGDESALAQLYDRHSADVFALCLRIVRDHDLAQEALQDTFLRCWTEAARYEPERGRVSSWLSRMARNRSIDILRSRSNQARSRERADIEDLAPQRVPVVASQAEASVDRQWVAGALADLPEPQRQALELAYFGGFSQTEIAARLKEPLGTIKTRMRRGLEKLRDILEPRIGGSRAL